MSLLRDSVADQLVDLLGQAGIRFVYGVPGDAINDLVDAIRRQDTVEFVQVRHEEAGAFAASAQAKLTGELTCCVGTAGGGAIHLLNGLYDAKLDHAPVLAITGQVPRFELGSQAHQEIDSNVLFEGVTVFNQTVVSARQLPELAVRACRAAQIERGVSHISLPDNLAGMKARSSSIKFHRYVPACISPRSQDLECAKELINQASKPVMLIGTGAHAGRDACLALAEKIGSPVIRSLRAKDVLADDHPLSLGGLGLLGTRPSLDAIMECDLLLMMGSDFPYSDYLPRDANIIQVDINSRHLGRRCAVDVGMQGDAREVAKRLFDLVENKTDQRFLQKYQNKAQQWREQQAKAEEDTRSPIRPQHLARQVGEAANKDAVFLCDTGAVTAWVARHLPVREGQRFTLSGNLATMAFAMSGALGAQQAFPGRQVIALTGDGGFAMLMQDFLTAVKYQLPINVVVFNNAKLGLIQLEQETRGNPEYQTDLHNPDFAEYARLCGGEGWRVTEAEQLPLALEQAFASDKPTVVDVAIDPDELIMPPRIEMEQAFNYSLSKVKEFIARN